MAKQEIKPGHFYIAHNYQGKDTIVIATNDQKEKSLRDGMFTGVVIWSNNTANTVGDYCTNWGMGNFTPCELRIWAPLPVPDESPNATTSTEQP